MNQTMGAQPSKLLSKSKDSLKPYRIEPLNGAASTTSKGDFRARGSTFSTTTSELNSTTHASNSRIPPTSWNKVGKIPYHSISIEDKGSDTADGANFTQNWVCWCLFTSMKTFW